MAAVTEKLNRAGRSHTDYYSLPLDLKGAFGSGHFSAAEKIVMSAIRSYSVGGRICEFTYSEIGERYGMSRATVGRVLKAVRENGKFERGKRVYQYRYQFDENDSETDSKGFVKVYNWLNFAVVSLDGKNEYLTRNEIHILSLIRGYAPNGYTATARHIARRLNISHDTATRAIARLQRMGLIRIEYPKGYQRSVNNYTRAKYISDEKAIRKLRDSVVKHEKAQSSAIKAADERTAREQYYARRQAEEQDRIDELRKQIATQEEGFAESEKTLSDLDRRIGQAQAKGFDVRELLSLRMEMARRKRAYLEELGLTEEDLEPRYKCPECRDSGNRNDGSFCDCWRRRS